MTRPAIPTQTDRLRFSRIDRRVANRLANPRTHETGGWVPRDELEAVSRGAVVHSSIARIRPKLKESRGLTITRKSLGGGLFAYRIEPWEPEEGQEVG